MNIVASITFLLALNAASFNVGGSGIVMAVADEVEVGAALTSSKTLRGGYGHPSTKATGRKRILSTFMDFINAGICPPKVGSCSPHLDKIASSVVCTKRGVSCYYDSKCEAVKAGWKYDKKCQEVPNTDAPTTQAPTSSPTTVPTSAPTTCEIGCNVQGEAVFDTCIVHDRDVASNLCYAGYKDTRDSCVEGDVVCSNTAYEIFERCCKRKEKFFVDDCHACDCNGICSGK